MYSTILSGYIVKGVINIYDEMFKNIFKAVMLHNFVIIWCLPYLLILLYKIIFFRFFKRVKIYSIKINKYLINNNNNIYSLFPTLLAIALISTGQDIYPGRDTV